MLCNKFIENYYLTSFKHAIITHNRTCMPRIIENGLYWALTMTVHERQLSIGTTFISLNNKNNNKIKHAHVNCC